ncbi:hypothetical protein RHSIM_Rhsim07G0001500 [Rhododendron simsii]|uniref:Cytochrome b5 heme-binding domain-containing protein n=1 Tax=Rhododendron simsii TaxID=118357 RepID=A0A834LI72_RHOSS|nr:hypothetical protein RHSIM_Rhsim07G0001500 [Rhododendron simsii]
MTSNLEVVHPFEEVAKHNHKGDCWLIISGKVIDLMNNADAAVQTFQLEGLMEDSRFVLQRCNCNFTMAHVVRDANWHDTMVYDVTSFLDDHPGGDEVLITATGKDATDDFEDVGHSDSAKEMMSKYLVGEVDSSTIPAREYYKPPSKASSAANQSPGILAKILQFLVPLLIVGLAFALRQFTKKDQ